MKLLRVVASYFKNCRDNFMIDLISKSKRTSEDKEYELHEIDEGLYVYNTVAFVGKNASGKTTAVELLDCCYSILGEFRVENKTYQYDHVTLDIIFYHEGMIYRYFTKLEADASLENKAVFTDQHIFQKKYYKSRSKSVYDERDFKEMEDLGSLPEDTSIVFFVLKKSRPEHCILTVKEKGHLRISFYLRHFEIIKFQQRYWQILSIYLMKIFVGYRWLMTTIINCCTKRNKKSFLIRN